MRALSINTVSSLRHFHDTVEDHIRGLSALGTPEESYSTPSYMTSYLWTPDETWLDHIPPKIGHLINSEFRFDRN